MPRGISSRGDILATTIDGVSLDAIWQEYIDTLSIWNSSRSPIANLFTQSTIKSGDAVSQAAEGDDFEEASEFGVPQSHRASVEPLVLGYPLKWYDAATRYTEGFLRDATAEEVRAQHAAALEADNRLVFKKVMQALFTKTTIATRPVNSEGATIYGLWDGEADSTPPAYAGKTFASGHNHYLVSGAATIDGGDLRDITNTILEHGYSVGQGEHVVILMNPAEGEVVRSFRVADGDPFDFIPSASAPAYLTTENIVGERPPAQLGNLPVFGSYGKALLVEDYHVPVGYLAATATDTKPLAFREHTRAEYRGLRTIPGGDSRRPIIDSRYSRGFGVGVQHRGAAAVMKIAASGSYTPPAL